MHLIVHHFHARLIGRHFTFTLQHRLGGHLRGGDWTAEDAPGEHHIWSLSVRENATRNVDEQIDWLQ